MLPKRLAILLAAAASLAGTLGRTCDDFQYRYRRPSGSVARR